MLVMSANLLKQILSMTGKTVIDVAAATKIHPNTINRYLKGDRVNPSTEAALKRWVQDHSKNSNGPEAA